MIHNLLLDQKANIPGYASSANGLRHETAKLYWFPRGYNGEPYVELMRIEQIPERWLVAEDHPYFKEHGYPADYHSIRREVQNRLFEFVVRYANGNNCIEELTDYVMELIND